MRATGRSRVTFLAEEPLDPAVPPRRRRNPRRLPMASAAPLAHLGGDFNSPSHLERAVSREVQMRRSPPSVARGRVHVQMIIARHPGATGHQKSAGAIGARLRRGGAVGAMMMMMTTMMIMITTVMAPALTTPVDRVATMTKRQMRRLGGRTGADGGWGHADPVIAPRRWMTPAKR